MQTDFFDKVFSILEIPDEVRGLFLQDLAGIIAGNVGVVISSELNESQKDSLKKLIQEGKTDEQLIGTWIKENKVAENKEISQKIEEAIKESILSFFEALTVDLDDGKRKELLSLCQIQL